MIVPHIKTLLVTPSGPLLAIVFPAIIRLLPSMGRPGRPVIPRAKSICSPKRSSLMKTNSETAANVSFTGWLCRPSPTNLAQSVQICCSSGRGSWSSICVIFIISPDVGRQKSASRRYAALPFPVSVRAQPIFDRVLCFSHSTFCLPPWPPLLPFAGDNCVGRQDFHAGQRQPGAYLRTERGTGALIDGGRKGDSHQIWTKWDVLHGRNPCRLPRFGGCHLFLSLFLSARARPPPPATERLHL